jgi:pyruvate/2-oxoglutarate dehydrogenase complex dihydrolipoamide dehydrogenase (E3) component
MAQAFARFGAAVVVIESGSGVLPREDRDAGAVIEQALRSDGVRFRLSATIARVAAAATLPSDKPKLDALKPDALKPDALKLDGPYPAFSELSQASGAGIRAAPTGWTLYGQGPQGAWEETVDRILVATGRRPNIEGLELEAAGIASGPHGVRVDDFLRTANRRVYAAGDVCSPYRFTHAADFMARAVVRNALFLGRARLSELVIPWCTYTDPEVAHVGLCEQQAVEAGIAVDVLVQPLAEVDRAILEAPPFAFTGRAGSALSDGPAGFVKVLLRRGTDRIVGATLVAPHAGEMVGELTLAIRQRLGIGELGNTIHPYPTVADAIRKLGDQYQRRRLTPRVRLLFRRWFDWWR